MNKNFLFHRVNPERDPLWDPMDVGLFERCIRHITKTHQVVLLEELVLNKSHCYRKNFATIIFDDGYKDIIEFALPILNKYKVKASFYVVTDCIEHNLRTWTYILDYRFRNTNKTDIGLNYEFLPLSLKVDQLATTAERVYFVKQLKPVLKRLAHEQRSLVLKRVEEKLNDTELPELMMNWQDLSVLKKEGHYIGSHTVTHSMLATMGNESDIRRELVDSAKKIEEKLGHFPLTISYPVGSYNEVTMRLSKETGYQLGLAVNQIPYCPGKHGNFEIPRIELYNESWLKTRVRIGSSYYKLRKFLKPA
jgi:peptidoglycan/xylan/chitin deacetylase (PgdA/CDA1 family)